MAALMLFLKGLVVWVLAGALSRILIGAGIAFVTYTALDDLMQSFLAQIVSFLSGLPAAVLSILLMMGVGDALSILGSALMTVASIKAATYFLGVRVV